MDAFSCRIPALNGWISRFAWLFAQRTPGICAIILDRNTLRLARRLIYGSTLRSAIEASTNRGKRRTVEASLAEQTKLFAG
jgi:hypothetical protein